MRLGSVHELRGRFVLRNASVRSPSPAQEDYEPSGCATRVRLPPPVSSFVLD
jgi:hypothetical protein